MIALPVLRGNTEAPRYPLGPLVSDAAWSVARKLRASYTGSAFRVRRSSDNAEQDIGFTSAGLMDSAALTSFVGANSGFVATLYDQTTNGRNPTQATAARQPRIVNAGTIDVQNGIPAMRFLGGQFLALASWATVAQPFMRNMVAFGDTTAVDSRYVNTNTGTQTSSYGSTGVLTSYGGSGNFGTFGSLATNHKSIYTALFNGTSSQAWLNGTGSGTASGGTAGYEGIVIGAFDTSLTTPLTGWIAEMMLFNSSLSTADRTGLERNQGRFYGITVA